MPNKDGTGPEGKGAGTGRRMGNCEEVEFVDEEEQERVGRGRGFKSRNG